MAFVIAVLLISATLLPFHVLLPILITINLNSFLKSNVWLVSISDSLEDFPVSEVDDEAFDVVVLLEAVGERAPLAIYDHESHGPAAAALFQEEVVLD